MGKFVNLGSYCKAAADFLSWGSRKQACLITEVGGKLFGGCWGLYRSRRKAQSLRVSVPRFLPERRNNSNFGVRVRKAGRLSRVF